MDTFLNQARKHWTSERVKKVTGGKSLILTPDQAPDLLRAMGLLNKDTSMSANNVRKYRQINHMLALMAPEFRDLAKRFPTVRVVDFGCGNSYLTILIAWYFCSVLDHPLDCTGLDSNPKTIAASRERARVLGYEGCLKFVDGDVGTLDGATRPHAVIALHACDTATDHALAFGIRHKADYMAVAPCCQAELARRWTELVNSDSVLAPIYRSHHFRREIAADMTDVLRMLLIRSRGYEVTATEFVAQEHAVKNRLLTCIRRGAPSNDLLQQFVDLKKELGDVTLCLERQL